jgi:hypothetical protein
MVITPVIGQALIVLNSVPRGSGFHMMKKIFGNPPKAVVLGLHALMDSSATFHLENLILKLRILLNSSIAAEKLYHGPRYFNASFNQISGNNLLNSLKHE